MLVPGNGIIAIVDGNDIIVADDHDTAEGVVIGISRGSLVISVVISIRYGFGDGMIVSDGGKVVICLFTNITHFHIPMHATVLRNWNNEYRRYESIAIVEHNEVGHNHYDLRCEKWMSPILI
jgi:hypothetical protein